MKNFELFIICLKSFDVKKLFRDVPEFSYIDKNNIYSIYSPEKDFLHQIKGFFLLSIILP